MADTRPDINLVPNVWTDLYAASGINIGAAISIWNKGSDNILIAIKATAPTDNRGMPLYTGVYGYAQVTQGESGVWAMSKYRGSVITVQEI